MVKLSSIMKDTEALELDKNSPLFEKTRTIQPEMIFSNFNMGIFWPRIGK